MKYIFFLLLSAITLKTTLGQTRETPTGVLVPVDIKSWNYSEAQVEAAYVYWDSLIAVNHWHATIIEFDTHSGHYNCHANAWHISDGGDTVCIDTPVTYYFNGPNDTYSLNTDTLNLSKVYYNGGLHSAITTDTPNIVISKWGPGPLVRHKVRDCPYISYNLKYYQIPTSGATSVHKGTIETVSTLLNINGANYNWSGDGNFVCASGSTLNGSVTGLNTTSTYGGKAYVSIQSPYSNTTVKGVRFLNVTSQVNFPYISGQTLVCTSGQSFTLHDVPVGSTITWSSNSSSILYTANNHANPCTFTSTGNGSGWIQANLSTSCGSNILTIAQYPVWSGSPVFTSISGPYSTPNHQEASFYVVPDIKEAITSYTWNLNPLNGNTLFPSGPSLIIAFYNPGNYQLLINAHNACGTGPIFWRGVYVYNTYGLIISPNPASTTVNVTIINGSTLNASDSTALLTETAMADYKTKYTVSIFNSFGTQLLSTQKTGASFSLQVDNLPDGLYILVVNDGKNKYSAQLVVNH